MAVDLIPIKISVVGVAIGVVHADGLVPRVSQNANTVSHDARLVKGRLAIDQHAVAIAQVPPHLNDIQGRSND